MEPIRTSVEGDVGVPVAYLGGELRDVSGLYVWRVGDEHLDTALEGLEAGSQIRLVESNLGTGSRRIAAGYSQGPVRVVGRVNLTGGTLLGDGDRYRAGAGAKVEDTTGATPAIYTPSAASTTLSVS